MVSVNSFLWVREEADTGNFLFSGLVGYHTQLSPLATWNIIPRVGAKGTQRGQEWSRVK